MRDLTQDQLTNLRQVKPWQIMGVYVTGDAWDSLLSMAEAKTNLERLVAALDTQMEYMKFTTQSCDSHISWEEICIAQGSEAGARATIDAAKEEENG